MFHMLLRERNNDLKNNLNRIMLYVQMGIHVNKSHCNSVIIVKGIFILI